MNNKSRLLPSACVGRGLTCPEESNTQQWLPTDTFSGRLRHRVFARFSLLRSIAFRMGIMFWLLFTLCFGIGACILYETLQDRLLDRIDQSILNHFVEVKGVYKSKGLPAVIRMADARSHSPMASTMGFHLASKEGERIAGNVPVCLTEPGWNVLSGKELGLVSDSELYRFYTTNLGGNVLSLGRSMKDMEELRKISWSSLLGTTLAAALLAFLAAWYFARRTHKRVAGISKALNVVGQGHLNARLPVSCAGDDVDKLSAQINDSLARLEHTVNGMRQVSTDIAHDLKTPLNRLYITIEDAANKSRAGACVGDELDGALDEAQAINATFEALLRIAQIEAGARRSQFKSVDLSRVLETAAEVYAPVVEEQGQQLHIQLMAGTDMPVLCDRNLVLQLVVNLIENAVNHCAEDTVITLSAGEDAGKVWFRVADSGQGIPEAEREKVFQRLYRLERSRTTRGTGLGLSLVKAIVDLHGGSISLSDNHPGLVVTVRFDRYFATEN